MSEQTEQQNIGELTPPSKQQSEKVLTATEKIFLHKNRSSAFAPPSTSCTIPMLDGAKNWDHWYNSILGMCEMADIDGVLTGHDTIPVQMDKETDKAFSERTVY